MFEYVARVGEIEILILVLARYMMECCGFECGRLV
jgi:hypothetical protein